MEQLNEKQTFNKLITKGEQLIRQYNKTKNPKTKKLILAKLELINNCVSLLLAPYKKQLDKIQKQKEQQNGKMKTWKTKNNIKTKTQIY